MCSVKNVKELEQALNFAKREKIKAVIIGEGSNTIWSDAKHNLLGISLKMKGIRVVKEDRRSITYEVGAGLHWDKIVKRAIKDEVGGIECLSGIPGTVGAAPVQNIGAYGQEIKNVLISVTTYDLLAKKVVVLSNKKCKFSYRSSVFKSTHKDRYIILSVTLRLRKHIIDRPKYESLKIFLKQYKIQNPGLKDIRRAVLAIRRVKLPDPSVIPNCGSFFENPVVDMMQATLLKEKYPDIKIFSSEQKNKVKIPAGWLIEKAGFKGKNFGNIKVYENNALVLMNADNGTFGELTKAKDEIVEKIKNIFGIELKMEPNIIT